MNKKSVGRATIFGGGDMKRSPSELLLEELFSKDENFGGDIRTQKTIEEESILTETDGLLSLEDHAESFADVCAAGDHIIHTIPLRNQGLMNSFPSCGGLTGTLSWSQNVTSKQCCISTPIDSQSSICVGSPNSATNLKIRGNQAMGATSGSSPEQSDDDIDTEAGPCEQSTDPIDEKRIKRMVSNRESARRSRSRKQAHLVELEQQVDQLRGETASLFKQLTNATQQFKDATTNNRVLKSDVEALRAKVKLAEDMVARGSLMPSLGHLLQNHLSNPLMSTSHNICRLGNVSPTVNVGGDDISFPGMTVVGQNSTLGVGNADAFSGGVINGIIGSDALSCVPENWASKRHVPTISK
ncbi:hypothetical protein U1Q18_002997 [Sarracenia purpurea var. burkii]